MQHVHVTAARYAFAITPSDATNFDQTTTSGVYVGGTGAVTAVMVDGKVVTFSAVPVGAVLPIEATRINATGTTATLLVGLVN